MCPVYDPPPDDLTYAQWNVLQMLAPRSSKRPFSQRTIREPGCAATVISEPAHQWSAQHHRQVWTQRQHGAALQRGMRVAQHFTLREFPRNGLRHYLIAEDPHHPTLSTRGIRSTTSSSITVPYGPLTSPCTGEILYGTVTFSSVDTVVMDASGGIHTQADVAYSNMYTGDRGTTFTESGTAHAHRNRSSSGGVNTVEIDNSVMNGSDSTAFSAMEHLVFVVGVDGIVQVQRNNIAGNPYCLRQREPENRALPLTWARLLPVGPSWGLSQWAPDQKLSVCTVAIANDTRSSASLPHSASNCGSRGAIDPVQAASISS